MKKIIVVLLMLCPLVVGAQRIIVHSPTAANLGLYGEIPVSYYTGVPDISIPLYELKGKNLTVPIRLSYHPAGIRPEIHPGPAGLGWSLQAGGVISRTVRGNSHDESEWTNGSGLVQGFLHYAQPTSWMAQSDWKDYMEQKVNSSSDLEPDEFGFSIPGLSGKFYFDHRGEIQVQCDRPVKVIFNNEFITSADAELLLKYNSSYPSARVFKSFTIVDEQGTRYHFGGAGAIEFSDPISYGRNEMGLGVPGTGQLLQANSWFLTQIISADGRDDIRFEYERGPFIAQLYRSYDYYSYSGARMSGWGFNSIDVDGTLISPVYLKRIRLNEGEEVELFYSTSNDLVYTHLNYRLVLGNQSVEDYLLLDRTETIPRFNPIRPANKFDRIQWLKVDDIVVKDVNAAQMKRICFAYNNKPTERLFLESLKIYGENASASPLNYAFAYKNRDRMPAGYLDCITDHWGFNNGRRHAANGFNFSNKSPNAYYTDSGVLSSIVYPTGGSATFEYELHDYAKVVDTKNRSLITDREGTASGLRIRKITTDGVTREFFYKESPNSPLSSGVLNTMPQYSYIIIGRDCGGYQFEKKGIRSLPVIPLTKDNEGLYIGYTHVCEQVSGGGEGYVQYHFTNHDNGHHDVLLPGGLWHREIFPADPHCSRYFERGRLLKETCYNAAGQQVACKETLWNRYGSQGEDNPRALFSEGVQIGYGHYSTAAYLHYCYKFLPSRRIETVYDAEGQHPITVQTDYTYNSKHLPSRIKKTLSDGTTQTESLKYPSDFTVAPYPAMVEKNMLSPVVETSVFKGNSLIDRVRSDYSQQYGTFYVPVNKERQIGEGSLHTIAAYRYDRKANLVELVENGADTVVYLWSYSERYPVAEIGNATYADVESVLGATAIAAFAAKPNPSAGEVESFLAPLSINERTKDAQVTRYTHKPAVGVETQTLPNGLTTRFVYDSFGRLRAVRDHNGKMVEQYEYNYKQSSNL